MVQIRFFKPRKEPAQHSERVPRRRVLSPWAEAAPLSTPWSTIPASCPLLCSPWQAAVSAFITFFPHTARRLALIPHPACCCRRRWRRIVHLIAPLVPTALEWFGQEQIDILSDSAPLGEKHSFVRQSSHASCGDSLLILAASFQILFAEGVSCS